MTQLTAPEHDRELATAFDGQAERFEDAPVQSDPDALERLIRAADLPPDSWTLDAGCGPGLVCEALLRAGHRVLGVDLSNEMIGRARRRCITYGDRAVFEQRSLFDPGLVGPFDATISRYVLHHMADPSTFVQRQVELLRPGGLLVLNDHTTDVDPDRSRWHQDIERLRDRTHTANLTPGSIVDLLARSGLAAIQSIEEPFSLDFDEWFDRGTPTASKAEVRRRLLSGPGARGFRPTLLADGSVRIDCWRSIVRGVKI